MVSIFRSAARELLGSNSISARILGPNIFEKVTRVFRIIIEGRLFNLSIRMSQLRAEQQVAVLFRVGRYHGHELTHATLCNQELDGPTTDLTIFNVLLPQVLWVQQNRDRLPAVRTVNV